MICKFTILYRFLQKIFRPLPERMPYTGNFYPYPVARGTHGVSALPVSWRSVHSRSERPPGFNLSHKQTCLSYCREAMTLFSLSLPHIYAV